MESASITNKRLSSVRSLNTKPEVLVRKLLHSMGYRFRLHRKDLPGKPDIILPKYRKIILVHGCYWHRHEGCSMASEPKRNKQYWEKKFERNRIRDNMNYKALNELGWKVMVVWECHTKKTGFLRKKIKKFLNS